MPPKRTRSGSSKGSATTNKKLKGKRELHSQSKKRTEDDYGEDSDDSEKEIGTIQDYEEAVRKTILKSTTNRYENAPGQDQLALAASLMMPSSPTETAGTLPPSEIGTQTIYSLGTFCLHAIAMDFHRLAAPPARTYVKSAAEIGQMNRTSRPNWPNFQRSIQHLPFYLSTKLFKFLRHSRPELLSTRIWTSLFFPLPQLGDSSEPGKGVGTVSTLFVTDLDLEGLISSQVTDTIIRAHFIHSLDLGPQLERINLNFMDSLSDKVVAQLVGSCPGLARLSLKGCSKVGDLTLASLPSDSIQQLNISFTVPTSKGIRPMLFQCRQLVVLKMVGLVHIKDAMLLELQKEIAAEDLGGASSELKPLSQLQNLKISTTKLGDRGLKVLLELCGRTLQRLDISGTQVTRAVNIAQFCVWDDENETEPDRASAASMDRPDRLKARTELEKLNMTRLALAAPTDFLNFFKRLPTGSLHTLLLGYITCGQVQIRDDLVDKLCDLLELGQDTANTTGASIFPSLFDQPSQLQTAPVMLHTLSFFGNPLIGESKRRDYGLHRMLKILAPTLKRLELGYTQCKTHVLAGLLPIDPLVVEIDLDLDALPRPISDDNVNLVLEELGLDDTPIQDEVSLVLQRFPRLNRLSLVNTWVGTVAVERVVLSCPLLTSLDLTSCRAISVLQRRSLLADVRKGIFSRREEEEQAAVEARPVRSRRR